LDGLGDGVAGVVLLLDELGGAPRGRALGIVGAHQVGGLVGDLRGAADPPQPEALPPAGQDAAAVGHRDLEQSRGSLDVVEGVAVAALLGAVAVHRAPERSGDRVVVRADQRDVAP
ncbi:MAG: hypothetical protein ACK55I_44520, partial [bacterium]